MAQQINKRESKVIEDLDASMDKLFYGDRIYLKPAGLDYRLPTHFIGMERRSYLIVRLSPLGVDAHNVYPFLYQGNTAKLFFTSEGVLQGYLSNILAYNVSPYRHIYISYPQEGEFFTLREYDRFDCHLPASLDWYGAQLQGMLVDLSHSGCRVCLDAPPEGIKDIGGYRGKATLTFSLLTADKHNVLECEIKNATIAKDKLVLGLAFGSVDKKERGRIEEFLHFLGLYRNTPHNARR